jgi:hypothetical protein
VHLEAVAFEQLLDPVASEVAAGDEEGASGSVDWKRPASATGWVTQTHSGRPGCRTRAASATAAGMSSTSIREL